MRLRDDDKDNEQDELSAERGVAPAGEAKQET
jgi:hypothetical protein